MNLSSPQADGSASLKGPRQLNGSALSEATEALRPGSEASVVPGRPRLWKALSVSSGPLWQLTQLPRPMKSLSPLRSLGLKVASASFSSPFDNASA